ncbi:MAG: thermonuclease family protein [Wenzhouxiangella sp.]|jgi:endonuclease YncB( thermonuclease family)|nr:thermonuclease family protein [Wenzhouxiangella sp.]
MLKRILTLLFGKTFGQGASGDDFDAASAHKVSPQRVLEGPAYVIDGDTIKIKQTQVRLYGIDAPELDHPFGEKAKWAMVRLCRGHPIRAEITDEDKYGRTVAKCFLPDGRDLSAELVKQGLAIDWPKFSGGQYGRLEVAGIRRKLWLADARQKGRMHVWEKFDARKKQKSQET